MSLVYDFCLLSIALKMVSVQRVSLCFGDVLSFSTNFTERYISCCQLDTLTLIHISTAY